MRIAQEADNKAMNNLSQEERNKLINVNGGKAEIKYIAKRSSEKPTSNVSNIRPGGQKLEQDA